MTPSHYSSVLSVLMDYYDGLHRLDSAKLAEVFAPDAHYATTAGGTHLTLTMDEYFQRLEQRDSPADTGTPHGCRVNSIRFAGDQTAMAEVESSLFGHDYTDFLSLLCIDGRWRIQAKVFHGVPHQAKEAV